MYVFQIRHNGDYIRPSAVYAAAAAVAAAAVADVAVFISIPYSFMYSMRVQSSHALMAPKVENISCIAKHSR